MNPIYVGIDISSKKNKAVILDGTGDRIGKPLVNDFNQKGAENFVRHLAEVMEDYHFDSVSVGLEATSVYGWHLQNFLLEADKLANFSPKLYCINPKLIHGFKKAYPDLNKTDDVDAFVIADRLRFGRLPQGLKVDDRYLPLQRLTRFRFHLMHSIVREKNYFIAHLFLKFSNYAQEKPFSNLFGAASAAVITELSVDEIASMPLEDLAEFISGKGKNHFPDSQAIAQALKKAARDAYHLKSCLIKNPST